MDSLSDLPPILENAPDVVYAFDAEGRFISLNNAVEPLLGYDRAEMLGQFIFEFIHPDDHQRIRESIAESVRDLDSGVKSIAVRMFHKSGQVRYFEVNRRLLFEGGKMVRNEGIARDVTEQQVARTRRQAVQGVREAVWKMVRVEDIDRLLEAIGVGLRTLEIAYEHCGINVVETEEKTPVTHSRTLKREGGWIEGNTAKAGDLVTDWWQAGEVVYRRDLESEDAYGELDYMQTLVPIRSVVDVPFACGTLAVNSLQPEAFSDADIEFLREVAEVLSEGFHRLNDLRQLHQTQVQLVQSEKMAALGNLVAGIAHEINTPVGAIHSMHDTLVRAVDKLKAVIEEDFPEDARAHQGLQRALKIIGDSNRVIESGTQRVTTIVRSLRNFARLDEDERKEVDLHAGLEDTLMLVYHDIKNRIEIERDYGELPMVSCYPGRLNQVFLNILNNAQQAIEDKGTIGVTTRVAGDEVRIEIADSGVGIAEDQRQRIFEPGFTTKGVGVGTGLGLSICWKIVEEHGGRIEVESEVGQGTVFAVVLPIDS